LNAAKSNAVLVCHALTLDQHVASEHPVTGKSGWWGRFVGPGLPLDPERHFIICSNVVGGCMGTTGPSSVDPKTGRPYALSFPMITIADMVRAQAMLVDALGIDTLFAVVGGSMGGMQVLQWAADYPRRVYSAVCIAAAARHSAQNIAFHEVGRQAIMADPDWRGGEYALAGVRPEKGLAVARMAAHITYLSEPALQRKFGRQLQRDGLSWGFDADFQVESYLRHQGASFVDRFDANSYLYITRAMDYFDLAAAHGGVLAEAFRAAREVRFCILSFTSDWLYPTTESRSIVRALNAAGCRASFVEIETDKGHDAFLLDEPVMQAAVSGFLESAAQSRGLVRGAS
jgi:homoserine O-acetyltransferase